VTAAETGYIVHTNEAGKDTLLAPDVGFIAKARVPAEAIHSYAHLAPDLAVEVVAPNDSASEIHAKVNNYLQYGTHAVWVANPETHTVVAHTPNGAKTLGENDTLDGGDVLPGFTLPVREIFS
jgi:Uma2 family endonuclease